MKLTKYQLKFEQHGHAAGTVVYDPAGWDYGLASDESRLSGIEHLSVTRDREGGHPYFVVPYTSLEKIGVQEIDA